MAWNAADSSLGIAYKNGTTVDTVNNRVRYAKVNTSTWAAPTWEDVTGLAGATAQFSNFDMDISDTGLITIVVINVDRAIAAAWALYTKATTGGAWTNPFTANIYNSHQGYKAGEACSVVCLAASSGIRDIVVAAGATGIGSPGARLYTMRVTESSGGASGSATLRNTFMASPFVGTDFTNATTKMLHYKLFRQATNTYVFCGMSRSNKTLYFHQGTFNAGTWNSTISEQTTTWSNKTWIGMGISYGINAGTVGLGPTFYVRDNLGVVWIKSFWLSSTSSFGWAGGEGRTFPNTSTQTVSTISDNSVSFPSVTDQDIVQIVQDSITGSCTTYDSYVGFPATMPGGNTGILSLTPASGEINVDSLPSVVAQVDTDLKYAQGPYQVDWQVASDAGFTTSVQTFRLPLASAVYVNGTDTPGVSVNIASHFAPSLSKQVWFYRARLVDQWNNLGSWFNGGSFTVGHPPTAVPTSPLSGGIYAWNGGSMTFMWNFTDPSVGDVQTAYQVQILDLTGTVLTDTGKVLSSAKSFTTTLAGALKDTQLRWQVKLWDSQDTAGIYSTPQQFMSTDPPVVPVSVPASGAVITTGVPTYTFTPTTGGSPVRRIAGYQIVLTSAADTVYTSPMISVDLASGTVINYKQARNILKNNKNYTLQVFVIDNAGLVGASAPIPFSTAWSVPATPSSVTADVSGYDVEGVGYNLVQWADTGRDAAFTHWTVYRQDDLIDPNTGSVLVTGTPQPIYDDYDTGSGYAYKDYVAPANQYQCTYFVTQWSNVAGQDIESNMGSSAVVKPVCQAYWLINQSQDTNTADTMRLGIVTDDSYTEEQEEAEFNVIGRGRVVNSGQYLGPKGSLTARLRNTGTLTARQKRLLIMSIIQETGSLQLRNPFGDIWQVNVSNIGVTRIAGVGAQEFCDVTLPYSEVS